MVGSGRFAAPTFDLTTRGAAASVVPAFVLADVGAAVSSVGDGGAPPPTEDHSLPAAPPEGGSTRMTLSSLETGSPSVLFEVPSHNSPFGPPAAAEKRP